mgnify:CR=1 FL=1
MAALSTRATFYGFLAADFLERPYSLCPETPEVPEEVAAAFLARDRVSRALELHRVGLLNWGRNEWTAALVGADRETLRAAAAVAVAEDWPDRAIAALGDSGDRRWYAWRFPSPHIELVRENPDLRNRISDLRRQSLRLAAHSAGYDDSLVEPAFAVFLEARHRVILYSDLEPALQSLRDAGYCLGTLTNGNADVERLDVEIIGLVRRGRRLPGQARIAEIQADDILILEASPDSIEEALARR